MPIEPVWDVVRLGEADDIAIRMTILKAVYHWGGDPARANDKVFGRPIPRDVLARYSRAWQQTETLRSAKRKEIEKRKAAAPPPTIFLDSGTRFDGDFGYDQYDYSSPNR